MTPAEEIEADTQYVLATLGTYERIIADFDLQVSGLRVLELGPGRNFGAPLILASRGAQVTLADRFLCEWGSSYHPAAYRALAERFAESLPEVVAAQEDGYDRTSLRLVREPAEAMSSIRTGEVDLTYSCAVLEHIYDVERVCHEIARVTRPQGYTAHQIDLRYHFHDFQRPLDHLVMSDNAHAAEAEASNYNCGNRVRSTEFIAHMAAVGFRLVRRDVSAISDGPYYDSAVALLRGSDSSYRAWPAPDLKRISAFMMFQKEVGAKAEALKEVGRDMLDLVAALKSARRP